MSDFFILIFDMNVTTCNGNSNSISGINKYLIPHLCQICFISDVYKHGRSFGPVAFSDLDKINFRDDILKKSDSYNVSFVKQDIG